jgi:hypothetical protein
MGNGILRLQSNSTTNADVDLLPSHKASGFHIALERKCRRKLTRRPPSITRAPQRRIVRRRSITGRANTIRATKSRRRPTNIPPRLIVTQPTPTGRVANTGRRNNPWFPGAAMPRPSGSDFSVNRSVLRWPLPKTPIALAVGHGSEPKHPRRRLKFGYGSTRIGTTPRGDPRSRCRGI